MRRGFTLIELISVMVIMLVLAAAAAPAVTGAGQTRSGMAARHLLRELSLARQWAVASGTPTWVVFDTSTDTWSLEVEDPASPGRSGATPLTDPGTGRVYETTLGAGVYVGVDLVSVDFDGSPVIGFDWLGRPLNSAEADLLVAGTVTIAGGHVLSVEVETGHVTHAGP